MTLERSYLELPQTNMNTNKDKGASIQLSRRTKIAIIRDYIKKSGNDPQSDLFYTGSSTIHYSVAGAGEDCEHDYEEFDGEWTVAEIRPLTFTLKPTSGAGGEVTMEIDQFDGGLFVEAFEEKLMTYELLSSSVSLLDEEDPDSGYDVDVEVELVEDDGMLQELTEAELEPMFRRVCMCLSLVDA